MSKSLLLPLNNRAKYRGKDTSSNLACKTLSSRACSNAPISPSHTAPMSSAYMLPGVSKHRKNRLKYPQDLPEQLGRLL